MLFDDMALHDGDEVPRGRVMQAKAEAEMAFVMRRDLDGPELTLTDVAAAVECVYPAIEIVGSRIRDWDIRLLDTIADNASSGMYVLGAVAYRPRAVDRPAMAMAMTRRGETVSSGSGAACLGNPLNAALWLAQRCVEVGRPLRAGDVVMSGALGPMVTVAPGDAIEARIDGLGSVRVAFAP